MVRRHCSILRWCLRTLLPTAYVAIPLESSESLATTTELGVLEATVNGTDNGATHEGSLDLRSISEDAGPADLSKRYCQTQPYQGYPQTEISQGLLLEYMMWLNVPEADAMMLHFYNEPSKRFYAWYRGQSEPYIERYWSRSTFDLPWVQDLQIPALQHVLNSLPSPSGRGALGDEYMRPDVGTPNTVNGGPCIVVTHVQDKQEQTGGTYTTTINPRDGIIIAQQAYGPEYQVRARHPLWSNQQVQAALPLIRQWSDVIYGEWDHLHLRAAHDLYHITPGRSELLQKKSYLNYFVLEDISEPADTVMIIMRGLEGHHGNAATWQNQIPEWPGVTFYSGDSTFDSILGTVNCRGIAWFLAQHKGLIGKQMLLSVTVFSLQPTAFHRQYPSLVFRVVDWTQTLEDQAKQRSQVGTGADVVHQQVQAWDQISHRGSSDPYEGTGSGDSSGAEEDSADEDVPHESLSGGGSSHKSPSSGDDAPHESLSSGEGSPHNKPPSSGDDAPHESLSGSGEGSPHSKPPSSGDDAPHQSLSGSGEGSPHNKPPSSGDDAPHESLSEGEQ